MTWHDNVGDKLFTRGKKNWTSKAPAFSILPLLHNEVLLKYCKPRKFNWISSDVIHIRKPSVSQPVGRSNIQVRILEMKAEFWKLHTKVSLTLTYTKVACSLWNSMKVAPSGCDCDEMCNFGANWWNCNFWKLFLWCLFYQEPYCMYESLIIMNIYR